MNLIGIQGPNGEPCPCKLYDGTGLSTQKRYAPDNLNEINTVDDLNGRVLNGLEFKHGVPRTRRWRDQ